MVSQQHPHASHHMCLQRPGVWQQLPRIPRLRTTAEGLTDAESAIPLPSVSIHAR